MRNTEKDAKEMAERRQRILNTGFEVFSSRTIESVPMQDIADACALGIATLYRYFPSKLDLVAAISAMQWRKIYDISLCRQEKAGILQKSAAEQFEFYIDTFIYLFKEHRAFLRFNYDFNLYISEAKATREQLKENDEAAFAFARGFHNVWERACEDKTLRTDISEMELFSSSLHILLAVASRYAAGLVYRPASEEDNVRELLLLKKMIMHEFVVPQNNT